MKVVIVGGGVMGTAIALELARTHIEVTVVERGIPGAEASTAAAGMLAPQLEATSPGPMLELSLRSRTLYPRWARALVEDSGLDVAYLESGALQLAYSEAEVHGLEASLAWQKAAGLRGSLLTADEVRTIEPNVSPEVLAAAQFVDDHQIDPRKLMKALSISAEKQGVEFRTGYVRRIVEVDGVAVGVNLDGEVLHSDLTIVAAGSWSSLVSGAAVEPQHLRPARGQMVELSMRTPPVRHVLKSGLGYVVPRADGTVLCGTTVELAGYDKRVTADGLVSVLSAATRACPALKDATYVASWAGLRPWTEDTLPLLGPGALRRLVIASGHFRNGILLAPITAKLVGQLVRNERPSVDLAPFDPTRFKTRPHASDE
jgi:glycine oxidase